ncbi:BRO-N domain-containing protein [Limosilactobacillus reuteri]|uniref:BRO-N domain-containing protein n=1 Tax=Limosilactobacillus reuteri TaxID=1598 RepID=UPI001E45625D|nr:Bro-N domain-containing protein [Limosilactobacillus reuteri]MCC4357921.1 Bro-N domain-containing protein [Limosilactobacillus reuteri]MCC4362236.1 Bro-N domain-containing protein [Limosilactobacillus reuteri]MCC4364584.1 Bro-N domain-containing protein [Limosilactobacillus reuteri]
MQLRVEKWNGFPIRFVEVNGEWLAITADVSKALDYVSTERLLRRIPKKYQVKKLVPRNGVSGQGRVFILLKEIGIYQAVFGSHKPEAENFKDWVFKTIQQLRKQVGLKEYEAFKMLDTHIQKQGMQRLDANNEVDYIKANTITNKAVANKYGLPKMISKEQMTQEMKHDRPTILNDVVDLMNVKRRFGLYISVSKTIYNNLEKHK